MEQEEWADGRVLPGVHTPFSHNLEGKYTDDSLYMDHYMETGSKCPPLVIKILTVLGPLVLLDPPIPRGSCSIQCMGAAPRR